MQFLGLIVSAAVGFREGAKVTNSGASIRRDESAINGDEAVVLKVRPDLLEEVS